MTAGWPLRAAGSHAEPLSPVRWCPIHAQHDTQPLRRDMPSAARSLGACRCASCATHPKWHSGQSKVGMSISLRIVYRRGGYAEPLAANLPVPQGFSDPSQCLVRQGVTPLRDHGRTPHANRHLSPQPQTGRAMQMQFADTLKATGQRPRLGGLSTGTQPKSVLITLI